MQSSWWASFLIFLFYFILTWNYLIGVVISELYVGGIVVKLLEFLRHLSLLLIVHSVALNSTQFTVQ